MMKVLIYIKKILFIYLKPNNNATTFEIYIDEEFAFRYVDLEGTSDDISNFTGKGYGFRHSNAELTFTIAQLYTFVYCVPALYPAILPT